MNQSRRALKSAIRLDAILAAVFGVVYFVLNTRTALLDPRRVDLVDRGDFAFHVLARNFAQWDTWHWPLARIANYQWPVGTSSVYTDSNPWLTVVTKLFLRSDTRPLQLVGPWLALCFALQGYFGVRLTALVTTDRVVRLAAGCLFVLAPVLLVRLSHDTLCAHWLLLACMTSALRRVDSPRDSSATLIGLSVLLTIAAGLHPTLFAMCIPFAGAAIIRRWRHLPAAMPGLVSCIAGPSLVFVAFGTLRSETQREVPGFGDFSANLFALVDPQLASRSAVFAALPHEPLQYEGFGYLGSGAIVAILISAFLLIRARDIGLPAGFGSAAVGATACAAFALSSRVYAGHHLLADISPIYRPLHAFTNAFRSSGRFVWPLTYLMTFVGVAGTASLRAPLRRIAILGVMLVQLVDVRREIDSELLNVESRASPSLPWALIPQGYTHLVLDPPDIESNGFKCDEAKYPLRYFVPLAEVAAMHHLSINSGQAARLNEEALKAYCSSLSQQRRAGLFDPDTIYVPSNEIFLQYTMRAELLCGGLDGYRLCVRRDRATPLALYLAAHPLVGDR